MWPDEGVKVVWGRCGGGGDGEGEIRSGRGETDDETQCRAVVFKMARRSVVLT